MNSETCFAKFRRYSRCTHIALAIALLLSCGQLILLLLLREELLGTECWHRIHKTYQVLLILALGVGFVSSCLMMRHTTCPHCGKSVFAKWWNYGRLKQIGKSQPILCAHCGKEVATK